MEGGSIAWMYIYLQKGWSSYQLYCCEDSDSTTTNTMKSCVLLLVGFALVTVSTQRCLYPVPMSHIVHFIVKLAVHSYDSSL